MKDNPIKSAIVILNWNGKLFLERFLPKLILSIDLYNSSFSHEGKAKIVIADNGSSDDSIDFLRKNHPDIELIEFKENYGFTGGYNRALDKIKAKYYILLNSDIEVEDGWLEPITHWMDAHPSCGACAPKLMDYNNRNYFEYAGAAGGYLDKFGYPFCRGRVLDMQEKDYGQHDEIEDLFWVSGACFMVRSELYHMLGGLDVGFFAHMEEIDLSWRIQLAGYNLVVVPESKVYHIGGGSLPKAHPRKLFLNFRNNLLMLSKNLAKTYAIDYLIDGYSIEKASKKAFRHARTRIFERMILDGFSALVYLLSFNFSYFKAVIKAHKEYRNLKKVVKISEIIDFLNNRDRKTEIKGRYTKWIIPMAYFHGKDVHKKINIG